jgi:hypothetical protein
MERAGGAERDDLGILRGRRASPRHSVNHNTSWTTGSVKEIPRHLTAVASDPDASNLLSAGQRRDAMDEIRMT